MRLTLPLLVVGFGLSAPAGSAEVVPVPAFRSVELRGGGEVSLRQGPSRVTILEGSTRFTRMHVDGSGKLRIDACNRDCPRVYRLRIEIQSPSIPGVAISGGGKIHAMRGFAAQQRISAAVNGGGQIDLRSVDAADVSAAVNGGGQILVRARRTLSAAVSGGGAIRYSGNPQVSMAVQGGGVVQPGT